MDTHNEVTADHARTILFKNVNLISREWWRIAHTGPAAGTLSADRLESILIHNKNTPERALYAKMLRQSNKPNNSFVILIDYVPGQLDSTLLGLEELAQTIAATGRRHWPWPCSELGWARPTKSP